MRERFPTLAGMPTGSGPPFPRTSLTALLALAALALGACQGSDSEGGEISPEAAGGLQGALSDLEGAVAADSCRDARGAVELFRERVATMGDVDETVRDRLEAGAERLDTLVRQDACEPSGTTGPATAVPQPAPTTTTEETTTPEDEEDGGEDSGGSKPPKPAKPPKPPKDEGDPDVPPGPPDDTGPPPTEETDEDGTGGTGTEEGG